jgi:hypothetical protein
MAPWVLVWELCVGWLGVWPSWDLFLQVEGEGEVVEEHHLGHQGEEEGVWQAHLHWWSSLS